MIYIICTIRGCAPRPLPPLHTWHDSFIFMCLTRRIHVYIGGMTTHSCLYLWHDCDIHICDVSFIFMCVTWLTPPANTAYTCVSRVNESCHTYEWVTSHVWMSHVTRMNSPCHTYEGIMSHMWKSHVTHINQSRHTCHTCEWVTSTMHESCADDMTMSTRHHRIHAAV